jgi:transmembrane 9 superfamily member 2/4
LQPTDLSTTAENLGEWLQGDNIQDSLYDLRMMENRTCQVLCATKTLTDEERTELVRLVEQEYTAHWILDNLPVSGYGDFGTERSIGFPIGVKTDTGSMIVFNHARMTIYVHEDPESYQGWRIVGFEVMPVSVEHVLDEPPAGGDGLPKIVQCPPGGFSASDLSHLMYIDGPEARKSVKLTLSYDTFFVPSDIPWASRWDVYLTIGSTSPEIHWFSIANSTVIAVFLTAMTALIMWRAVHRDLMQYNRVSTREDAEEEREDTGWKLIHTEVFRPPTTQPLLFAVMAGVGAQVSGMVAAVVIFAAIGFISPANRGSIIIAVLVLFCLMGFVAGYGSARNHRLFDGKQWQRTTLMTALAFPGFVGVVFFLLNLLCWGAGSTNAVPFGELVILLVLWLLVSVPLTFLGAYYGFKAPKIEFPTRVGAYPRVIPAQPWYLSLPFTMAVGGVLPFGAIFAEVYVIFSSFWGDYFYYMFGFLLLALILLLVTCAEIAIVLIYFQLCAEDYRWWWRSWLIPGSSAIYFFVYSILYFTTRLTIQGAVGTVLYFGYMLLFSSAFFLVTGSTGYLATFWFVHTIYAAVKVD